MKKIPPSRHFIDSSKQRFGGLNDLQSNTWERGTILDFSPNSHSYLVRTDSGRDISNIGRLLQSPGDNEALLRNTQVVISYALGHPLIIGVLLYGSDNSTELDPLHISEVKGLGGEDPVYNSDGSGSNRPPNAPQDLLPGDWIKKAPTGNFIATLLGGTNIVKSTPFAQVRTHAVNDMVEIISNVFRHITSMSELNILNDQGHTSLIWRAGSNESNETGANTSNWTIRLDIGTTGDIFNFEITTPAGQTLAKIHISADGKLEFVGVKGIDITSGPEGNYNEEIAGTKNTLIHGSLDVKVTQNTTNTYKLNLEENISKNRTTSIGNNDAKSVMGNDVLVVNGNVTRQIGGSEKNDYINGGLDITLGDPAKGSTAVSTSMHVVNNKGDIDLSANNITLLSNAIKLGALGSIVKLPDGSLNTVATTPFSACLYEPLNAFLNALTLWLDTHVHPTPGAPPAVPSSVVLKPLINVIKSQRVGIGA